MLTRLTIENIALVRKLELSFASGLTALTGETGAGKSVIVTALSLALGGRADKEYLRHGADSAQVTAVFDVSHLPSSLKREHPDLIDSDSITIRRFINRDGASRMSVNGKRIGLNRWKPLAAALGEILSQHASQSLMNEDNHLMFLDRFAGLSSQTEATAEAFVSWRNVADELRRLKDRREQLIQQRELLMFQKDEIEKGSLRVGEEEELLIERKLLDSARALMSSAASIGDILDGETGSAKELLATVRHELDKMARIDSKLSDQAGDLYDIEVRLEELRRTVEQYGATIVDDPVRIEGINTRLDEIYHLKKKYGGSEEAVLKTFELILQQLAQRPDTDSLIVRLESEADQRRREYSDLAVALSRDRRKAARRLEKRIARELADLAIDGARFEIAFLEQEDPEGVVIDERCLRPMEHGLEQARFDFAANPGEPLRPLVKTASGGEISRVLLALKSAERNEKSESRPLMVFDEVDAGIGGQTANEVGRKLRKLAGDGQLIVVTHLHQIARQADHHYVVEKSPADDRNVITVRQLNPDGVSTELERMVALPVQE